MNGNGPGLFERIMGIALYFVPAIIAFSRKRHNAGAIAAVNFFFGWTIIGWIISFIWAVSSPPMAKVVIQQDTQRTP